MVEKLHQSVTIERAGPDELALGDLVHIKDEADVEVNGKSPMYRCLAFEQNGDNEEFVVWVGPSNLTPRQVDQFLMERKSGLPLSAQFNACRLVSAQQIVKVLDS